MHEMVGVLVASAGAKKGLAEEAEQSAPALAASLVGAVESLATWWLDHPEVSDGMLASWVMNLVWLGFGELIEGKVWRPDEAQQP
jgi:hypothetical protein